jgi:ATP-dependent exoDNAse (exonuclease V) beta subunit
MTTAESLTAKLEAFKGNLQRLTKDLNRRGERFLSYSKVSTVESCEYRYLLEYVERVKLDPQPEYFAKGHLFHQAMARHYRERARGRKAKFETHCRFIDQNWDDSPPHLKNAIRVATENAWEDCEVVAVEEPFVLDLGKDLPPLLGIVDLVIRSEDGYTVVDHKTGKTFYEQDDLQLTLYREFVRRQFDTAKCDAFFDKYRWVNNLDRIRKPAMEREGANLKKGAFARAVTRVAKADKKMRRIEEGSPANPNGECFKCPFRSQCPEARMGWY